MARGSVGLTVTLHGLDKFQRHLDPAAWERATERGLDRIAIKLASEAKQRVPRKTGNLARSILPGVRRKGYREVVARAGYAIFVEEGTRPHTIVPRQAKVLAWPAGSGGRRLSGRPRRGAAMRFARRVNHPGTQAKPFMRPAIESIDAGAIMSAELLRVWKR